MALINRAHILHLGHVILHGMYIYTCIFLQGTSLDRYLEKNSVSHKAGLLLLQAICACSLDLTGLELRLYGAVLSGHSHHLCTSLT